ncbi:sugar phosphate isomerase/epimerase family protein [Paludibaculum fermentans]|uniref:sugar phosphate isomerase/epimerase family protein n=1 Tax=Paludibaculum fermentans TaxID=1473598 RepID=UPI003EC1182F
MQLGLINSAWFGSGVGTEQGIRLTREIGFDSIDIFADPLEIDARERRLIRDTSRDAGLPIVSVVCCALGIADFNTAVRRFHIERAKQHLDLGYEFSARNMLLVLGEYIWQQEVITPADQWKWAIDAVRELGEHAAGLGLEIAIELEPFHLSLVNTLPKMVQFLADVDHPAVLANVDISHLELAHTDPKSLAELRGRIGHVHLSDCDGKKHGDLPPGRGVVPFLPYLENLKAVGFDGAISIELEYSPDPSQIVEWVREAYRETNRMMQQLNLRGA